MCYVFISISTAISCGVPESPGNGSFHGLQYTVGSTVRYECDEGFWAENATLLSAVCLEDGTWSNAARSPRCLREPLSSLIPSLCQQHVQHFINQLYSTPSSPSESGVRQVIGQND